MFEGIVVLVLAVCVVGGVALYRRRVDGRFALATGPGLTSEFAASHPDRLTDGEHPARDLLTADELGVPLGAAATMVQFSSAFCAPCRSTRVVLADATKDLPGVAHVEVDAESHLELVRRLRIMRTPTVLVLNSDGAVINRAAGVPTKSGVLAVLGEAGVL